MPIEPSVVKPSDLNAAYPENGDLKAVGPQHFRNVKTSLLYLPSENGASEVGFKASAVTGAIATTVETKLKGWAELEADFGAVGDGSTDDTAAIQLAVDSGKRVRMRHGSTYKITQQIHITEDGAGLVGDGSQTIYMPAASFNSTTVSSTPNGTTNVCAIKITNYPTLTLINDILLKDFKIESEVSDGRYVVGVWAAYVTNFKIEGVEAFGFPASRVFQFDTMLGDSHCIDCYVHDCTTNRDDYEPNNPLIHALTLDSSRINSTPSDGFKILNFRAIDCIFGATAIAEYNEQSDGINLNGAGHDSGSTTSRNHLIVNPYIKNTGDCIDMFCMGAVIIGGQLIDGYNAGIKITTGARRNKIIGTHIVRPGLYGVCFESAELEGFTQDVEDNDVIGVTVEEVNPDGNWLWTNPFAFGTRYNGTPTFVPNKNRVIGCRVIGPNTNMRNAVRVESGDGNVFDVEGDDDAISDFSFVNTTYATNTVIRGGLKSHVRAYVNGSKTISGSSTETVEFGTEMWDTNGEYDPSTFTYTSSGHRFIHVRAQVRLVSASTGVYRMYIRKNLTDVTETEREIEGLGGDLVMTIDDIVEVEPGDTVKILFANGDSADRSMTGDSRFSFLNIEDVT